MENLLSLLSANELRLGKKVSLQKGEILYHEGEICHNVGILSKGSLTISSFSYFGKEIVYTTLLPGQPFGNNLLFSKEKGYRGDVLAKLESEVILFNRDSFLSILSSNPAFLKNYLSRQAEVAKRLNEKVKLLSFPSLRERFLYLLFMEGNRLEKSVLDLSKELRCERESLSRVVSSLSKEGTIAKKGKAIVRL